MILVQAIIKKKRIIFFIYCNRTISINITGIIKISIKKNENNNDSLIY